MRRPRRVVITGIGPVSPNGIGKAEFWSALIAGKSGIGPITAFDAAKFPSQAAGQIDARKLSELVRRTSTMGRFSEFAIAAARLAVEDANLCAVRCPVSIAIGTSVQGYADVGEAAFKAYFESGWSGIAPRAGLEITAHAATSPVQAALGFTGPLMTLASACCTGIDAIAWGAEQIRSRTTAIAVVGAAEAPLSEVVFGLFSAGGFLSTWQGAPAQASRPYDLHRAGLVLSEGAGLLVLEDLEAATARDAHIYAEILGYASWAEVRSVARRNPDEGYSLALQQAIRSALANAGLRPSDIDYICAHGNSTTFDDAAEADAHRAVFGAHAYRLCASSIKSMIGQPFSAGGALQTATAALALDTNMVPPTINLTTPDPKCDLDYVPNTARMARLNYALVHGHSLGGRVPGSHSALVIGSPRQRW